MNFKVKEFRLEKLRETWVKKQSQEMENDRETILLKQRETIMWKS
jgi:hypothetical protein